MDGGLHSPGFVAISWSPLEQDLAHTAKGFSNLLVERGLKHIRSEPGLLLYRDNSSRSWCDALELGANGVAIGVLFAAGSAQRRSQCVEVAPGSAHQRAKQLTSECWGRYVAFFEEDGRWFAFRDPSGGMPCWKTKQGPFTFAFSNIETVRELFSGLRPDWEALHAFLHDGCFRASASGLTGVLALPAGHMTQLSGDGTPQQVWSPAASVGACSAMAIAEALRTSVEAWASLYPRVGHQLSGGLDSSCVLACLAGAKAPADIECWTFYPSDQSEEDERAFARLAAAHNGCQLHEFEMSPKAVRYDRLRDAPLTPAPSLPWLSFADERLVEWSLTRNFGALMSGEGGDHLFLRSQAPLFAVDYARAHGVNGKLFETAAGAARISGQSIWRVIARAVHEGVLGQSPQEAPTPRLQGLFAPLDREGQSETRPGLPPGKCRQSAALDEAREYLQLSALNACLDGFPPMLSQPFVEACLATATYAFGEGGIDRAPLRRGFAQSLPREIATRRSKGGMTRYYCDALLSNLDAVRDLLLDGEAVQRRLVSCSHLEKILRREAIVTRPELDAIFSLIVLEHWVARWRP